MQISFFAFNRNKPNKRLKRLEQSKYPSVHKLHTAALFSAFLLFILYLLIASFSATPAFILRRFSFLQLFSIAKKMKKCKNLLTQAVVISPFLFIFIIFDYFSIYNQKCRLPFFDGRFTCLLMSGGREYSRKITSKYLLKVTVSHILKMDCDYLAEKLNLTSSALCNAFFPLFEHTSVRTFPV